MLPQNITRALREKYSKVVLFVGYLQTILGTFTSCKLCTMSIPVPGTSVRSVRYLYPHPKCL